MVIFGAGGQLGTELVREFRARGYGASAAGRPEVDLKDPDATSRFIGRERPKLVVNAAAYNAVDQAEQEPEEAWQVNALAVMRMARACHDAGASLVHYSTDYVFDGEKGAPYVEADPTRPIGAYAVSKLGGELYAQAYLENPLVIRTSGVFGPAGRQTRRGNFPELMLRLAGEGRTIRVVDDHTASPAYAPALAARSVDLIEAGGRGVFHIGGGQPISWYEYARLVFRAAGVKADLQPTNRHEYPTAARRPLYSALSNGKLEGFGVAAMPALEDAVVEYLRLR
ncbi:MAG: dTDP-4-dehydrorhamnose reductase [Bryobacteraceae bacterium]